MNNGNNDFLPQGYQIHRSLDRFGEQDRAAYLAVNVKNKQPVILEEFQYKEPNLDEIKALCQLKHPGIPQFLESFETPRGICLVQEYKKASPIHNLSNLSPEAFKYIAKSILDILIYLQNQSPVVFHQNLRPENIWFDNQRQIHVVGFGLSRKAKGIAHSGGTKVFKSREQLANRPLSKATDLYGLGVSLICLLTGTKPTEIDDLVNQSGEITFERLVSSKISMDLINWIEKLAQPVAINRHKTASDALTALEEIYLYRHPEVKLDINQINLQANVLGQELRQTIKINNFVTDTNLQGKWEIASHPSDKRYSINPESWIKIQPSDFEGNKTRCQIIINTEKLMADKNYKRRLILHTNTLDKTQTIDIQVTTPPLVMQTPPYKSLGVITATSFVCFAIGWSVVFSFTHILTIVGFIAGITIGAKNGIILGFNDYDEFKIWSRVMAGFSTGAMIMGLFVVAGFLAGGMAGVITGLIGGGTMKKHLVKRFNYIHAGAMVLLATIFGAGVGILPYAGLIHPLALILLIGGGFPLGGIIGWLISENQKLLSEYENLKPSLARP
ncbi:serine/threonine protein kinase [Calothrix parasitica NIES-267]|uniref:non-specific serine/threonine protein kinase n=1 Tax=Calothrix parasitica NIES-267 TaxID=1973488 RepID=A0A1Z4LZH2_9CYAN|nr:serine/threonine protein kinase [Calothrix parasitica NIES-267]